MKWVAKIESYAPTKVDPKKPHVTIAVIGTYDTNFEAESATHAAAAALGLEILDGGIIAGLDILFSVDPVE